MNEVCMSCKGHRYKSNIPKNTFSVDSDNSVIIINTCRLAMISRFILRQKGFRFDQRSIDKVQQFFMTIVFPLSLQPVSESDDAGLHRSADPLLGGHGPQGGGQAGHPRVRAQDLQVMEL